MNAATKFALARSDGNPTLQLLMASLALLQQCSSVRDIGAAESKCIDVARNQQHTDDDDGDDPTQLSSLQAKCRSLKWHNNSPSLCRPNCERRRASAAQASLCMRASAPQSAP